jgi:release factor glutamine methyltransferase
LDAEILLLHVLDENKAWLIAHAEEELLEAQAAHFLELIERRFRGEPIQYITGVTEFYGLPFAVRPDVLIPRPETEHLVEKAIELTRSFTKPRIVDVGTGSGAIAVSLAHQLQEVKIAAIDVSAAALDVARRNAEGSRVADRIRFLQGDLLEPVQGEQFDIVVSNPPYIATIDRDSLAAEVRDYEPALALFAGADGLDIYRRLIPAAYPLLAPGGLLVLEIGQGQSEAVGDLLEGAGFGQIEFVADLQGIPRVACGRRD